MRKIYNIYSLPRRVTSVPPQKVLLVEYYIMRSIDAAHLLARLVSEVVVAACYRSVPVAKSGLTRCL